ncbi:hypothetical protein [Ferrimonas gelatinilytica]|uniref:Antitoxin component YwqK of the YwqJK toxin-antitoxin module n=1 Tax=Ferrimonas gelatinilytica TaxID=1255257 RepID=A0ABP9RVW3_9GAMM
MRLIPLLPLFFCLSVLATPHDPATDTLDADRHPAYEASEPVLERHFLADGAFVDINLQQVKLREGRLVAGKRDGLLVEYFPDGAVRAQKHYRNGRKEGEWRWWYPNGQLKLVGHWQGVEGQHPDAGATEESEASAQSQFVVEAVWNAEGEALTMDGEGVYESRFPSGQVKILGRYRQGLRDGEWSYFDEAGTVVYREVYDVGTFKVGWRILDGMSIRYTEVRTEAQPPKSWPEYWASRPGAATKLPLPEILVTLAPDGRLSWLDTSNEAVAEKTRNGWQQWLAQAPSWLPATVRGKPVATVLTLSDLESQTRDAP